MTTTFPTAPQPSPSFNYDYLRGIEPGTEDFGIARLQLVMDFMNQAIRWGLEAHVQGLRQGEIPPGKGCQQGLLEAATFGLIELEDSEIFELINMENQGKPLGDMLFGEVIRALVSDNTVLYNPQDGTVMPTWEVPPFEPPADPELQDHTLDGVKYPVATVLSPEELQHWAMNREEFKAKFPNASYTKVATTAMHLINGVVYATAHEHFGKTSYLYNVRH